MFLEINHGSHQIDLQVTTTSGQQKILIAGRETPCDWVKLPDGRYSILVDDRVFDLSVALEGDTCSIAGREGTHTFLIRDPRRLSRLGTVEEGQAGLQRLCAKMPGKVIRVLVREGDSVGCDSGLLVIEAMKMQNEIRAPKAGVIREIGVAEGKAVSSGEFLISLE